MLLFEFEVVRFPPGVEEDIIEDEVALHRSHSIKIADYQSNMRGSGEKITGNLPPLSMQ